MLVDLHCPTVAPADADATAALEPILLHARDQGLDGICLAGRGRVPRAQWASLAARVAPLKLFVGAELQTNLGLLLWLPPEVAACDVAETLPRAPGQQVDAERAIGVAASIGGAVIVLQPLSVGPRRAELLLVLRSLGATAMEVFHGGQPEQENRAAHRAARKASLVGIGGSGGELSRVGLVATLFGQRVSTQQELVRVLRRGDAWAVALRS